MNNKRTQTWKQASEELEEIKNITWEIKALYAIINNDSLEEEKRWLYKKIDDKYIELLWNDWKNWKVKELLDSYELINGSDGWYKKVIEDFYNWTSDKDSFENRKENFVRLEESIFWKDIWSENELPWLQKRLNDLFEGNEKKYNDFYLKIEKELKAWTTSVALAKVFADRVSIYNRERALWSGIFVLGGMYLIYFLFGSLKESSDWVAVWLNFLQHLPIFFVIGWIGFFISSRQAESRKLEEAYRHKETMARAYFWYKDTIVELDSEGDSTLTKKHMENLLDAMKDDSSIFLSHSWEKHPLYDTLMKFLDKSWWKISIGDFTIESK